MHKRRVPRDEAVETKRAPQKGWLVLRASWQPWSVHRVHIHRAVLQTCDRVDRVYVRIERERESEGGDNTRNFRDNTRPLLLGTCRCRKGPTSI